MPCALTEPNNYPDYLKAILEEIAAGNDNDLKTCACGLRSPTTEDGCLIVDEDGKVGAFPFCISLVTSGVGDDTDYPLKLTLKQVMNLYWQTNSWNFTSRGFGESKCTCPGSPSPCPSTGEIINYTGNKRNTVSGPFPPKKNLTCSNYFLYLANGQYVLNGTSGSIEDIVIVSIFESSTIPMKYKKEGASYYFYPYFKISVGTYAVCASNTQSYAVECLGALGGARVGNTLSVPISILDQYCSDIKLYTRIYADSVDDRVICRKDGDVSISSLKFI